MARITRGTNPVARHAAVLCVSLAAVLVPLGIGGSHLGHGVEPDPSNAAVLTGAVLNCFAGPGASSCPGPESRWHAELRSDKQRSLESQVEALAVPSEATDEPIPWSEQWPSMEVRAGDTLFGLAAWFGVSGWDIAAFNGIDIDGLLVVGDTLWIPVPFSEFALPPEQVLYVSADAGEEAAATAAGSFEAATALVPVPAPTPPPPTPPPYTGSSEDVIAAICSMPWPCDQMVRIAYCESGLNPNSANPAGYYGLFQINYMFDGWNDPWVNARVAYENKYLPALAHGDPLTPWPLCRFA